MSQRVLVLGGTGLLGHSTIRELVARGYTVTSVALPPMPTEPVEKSTVSGSLTRDG